MDRHSDSAKPGEQKRALRLTLRDLRRSLAPETAREHAEAVCDHLLSDSAVRSSRVIAGYLAADGEVDLARALQTLADTGHTVVLPVLKSQGSKDMCFRTFDKDRLETGPFGLEQPSASCPAVAIDDIDLALMPLVGFDHHGNRLGMGGGYYDRTLADHPMTRIGIAHSVQNVPSLPTEPHDLALDAIATEHGLRWLRSPDH